MIDLSHIIPDKLVFVVEGVVVPLFLLFNILGWFGLPDREANRLPANVFSVEGKRILERAVRSAWLGGVLVALVVLWVLFSLLSKYTYTLGQGEKLSAGIVFGIAGLCAGIVRGCLPSRDKFRAQLVAKQRQILTWLVLAAVSISVVCAVLYGTYYTSVAWLRHLIASAYAFMLVGYSVAHLPDVIKGK